MQLLRAARPSLGTEEAVMLEETEDREEIIERVAALDIGKAKVVACVRVPSPGTPGRRAQEISTHSGDRQNDHVRSRF